MALPHIRGCSLRMLRLPLRYYPFRRPPSAKLLWVATEDDDENIPGIERLLALTDGVVAIALTLLVLQLQVPVTHDPRGAS